MTTNACMRCAERPAALASYWGDPLCSPCAQQLARLFDERGQWPPVPWEPDEVPVLGPGGS